MKIIGIVLFVLFGLWLLKPLVKWLLRPLLRPLVEIIEEERARIAREGA